MAKGAIAIEAKSVQKSFGNVKALDGLDLRVASGEVHGFLGPNGAGKSTTIRVLLGLLRANGGEVEVFGADPWRQAVTLHRRLAYIPGDVDLWPNLSGGEVIDMFGRLRGGVDSKRQARLVHDFELDRRRKCGTYSKGNRQKVAIVAALAADVELYIFDEPTSGLDPLMQAVFQRYVKELRDRGKTVLLSSHILGEVETLCDRVTIVKDGRTVQAGALEDFRQLHTTTVVAQTKKKPTNLKVLEGVELVQQEGYRIECRVTPEALSGFLSHLAKFEIMSLVSAPPTLEELFMHYYDNGPAHA